jgi:hypothetical protein
VYKELHIYTTLVFSISIILLFVYSSLYRNYVLQHLSSEDYFEILLQRLLNINFVKTESPLFRRTKKLNKSNIKHVIKIKNLIFYEVIITVF